MMDISRRTNQIFPNGASLQINGGQFISAQQVSYHKTFDTGMQFIVKVLRCQD